MPNETKLRALLADEGLDDEQITELLKDPLAHVKPTIKYNWLNSKEFDNLEDEQLVKLAETHKVVVMEGTLSEDASTVTLSYVVIPKTANVMEIVVTPEDEGVKQDG